MGSPYASFRSYVSDVTLCSGTLASTGSVCQRSRVSAFWYKSVLCVHYSRCSCLTHVPMSTLRLQALLLPSYLHWDWVANPVRSRLSERIVRMCIPVSKLSRLSRSLQCPIYIHSASPSIRIHLKKYEKCIKITHHLLGVSSRDRTRGWR